MITSVRVDPSGGLGILTEAQERQVPFVVSLALNWTANDAQTAERYRIKSGFHLQREAFNLQGIKIEKADRATKTSWRVVIQVQADRDYLNKMEDGGYKLPSHGRWIWKPNPEVFKGKVIPENLRPKALNFHPVGRNVVGNERTFMVKTSYGSVVKQRVTTLGARKDFRRLTLDNFKGGMGPATKKEKYSLTRTEGVRMLYQLVDRVSVPMKLEFVDTVSRTAMDVFPARLREAMAASMVSKR